MYFRILQHMNSLKSTKNVTLESICGFFLKLLTSASKSRKSKMLRTLFLFKKDIFPKILGEAVSNVEILKEYQLDPDNL